jgi:hypothetical protein
VYPDERKISKSHFLNIKIMTWTNKEDRFICDERNEIVCVLPAKLNSHNSSLIKHAPEMFEAIAGFCANLGRAGNPRNPKKEYSKLENLLLKISEEAL